MTTIHEWRCWYCGATYTRETAYLHEMRDDFSVCVKAMAPVHERLLRLAADVEAANLPGIAGVMRNGAGLLAYEAGLSAKAESGASSAPPNAPSDIEPGAKRLYYELLYAVGRGVHARPRNNAGVGSGARKPNSGLPTRQRERDHAAYPALLSAGVPR